MAKTTHPEPRAKTVSIYLTPETERILARRIKDPRERSETLRKAILRYDEVCRRDLPALSVAEWQLCCDALNGCWLLDQPCHWAALEIADAVRLNQIDDKWHVDWPGLDAKLQALSHGGWVALVDTVERFWAAVGRGEEAKVPGEDLVADE